MTVTMTAKNQITIPKKITEALDLERGSMFDIEISENAIELIPIETKKRGFTKKEYMKLDALTAQEKGKEKRVTKKFIDNLKKGRG